IAYVGEPGEDVTGENFKHGNLVAKGKKGVWIEPLDPGRYPINPRTHKVETVPTANIVLNWANGKSEAHQLDANLSTITVRSGDGFTFNLDVSQIIHIPRNDAPRVIARFGSMTNLVGQVLEPTIGNYFRNAAQKYDVIDFLRKRSERQADARTQIAAALAEYSVGAVDTLIGDIVPPPELMKTLTDRKLAEQEQVTYETQRLAEVNRQAFEQAKASANTQARVVDAERSVAIAEYAAQASVKKAEGDARSQVAQAEGQAKARVALATAEGEATRQTQFAIAEGTIKTGTADAAVIKLKAESITGDGYVAIQIADALSNSKQKLVPEIVAGATEDGQSSLVSVLLAKMLKAPAGSN
ncbi:MAG TPA: SPFH domain-containing protein, partial [Chloroflexota bacterium]|nr:SPFH domain-containing protein [Chloroflexota bacterium]